MHSQALRLAEQQKKWREKEMELREKMMRKECTFRPELVAERRKGRSVDVDRVIARPDKLY